MGHRSTGPLCLSMTHAIFESAKKSSESAFLAQMCNTQSRNPQYPLSSTDSLQQSLPTTIDRSLSGGSYTVDHESAVPTSSHLIDCTTPPPAKVARTRTREGFDPFKWQNFRLLHVTAVDPLMDELVHHCLHELAFDGDLGKRVCLRD